MQRLRPCRTPYTEVHLKPYGMFMAWHGFFCRGFSSIYRIAIYSIYNPPYALVKYRNEEAEGAGPNDYTTY